MKKTQIILFNLILSLIFCFSENAVNEKKENQQEKQEEKKVELLKDLNLELAKINDMIIYFKDIKDLYVLRIKEMQSKNISLNPYMHDFIVQGLVTQKIEEILSLEAAKKEGLKPDQQKTLDLISKFKSKFKTPEEYNTYLSKSALTEQNIIEKIQDRLLVNAFQENLLKSAIVTDEEAKTFFEKNQKLINPPEAYNIAQIMIYYPENSSDMEKKFINEKLSQIRSKIKTSEDFAKMATENSQAASAQNGGIIGWVDAGSPIDTALLQALKNIKPGEMTEVIQTKSSAHLLKLLDYRKPSQKNFESIKKEIIDSLLVEKKQALYLSFIENAKKDAKIEVFYNPKYLRK